MGSYSNSYKEAGVDITAGYESIKLMQEHIDKTMTSGVLSGIGGFGGLFMPNLSKMNNPVLVSGTDGVGTKLKIAFLTDKHDTVGIDCVAMCVNDIICSGAKPLFFLDYIATGKNYPERIAKIVSGVAKGCVDAGCALIGGETAEMPGFYSENEYDLAGFSVGIVDKEKIIDNSSMKSGDILIALPSSGVHSNGFSLVRKIFDFEKNDINQKFDELSGMSVGEVLLTPTKIYVRPILELLENVEVRAISHITGGGFFENIPRSLKQGLSAKINKEAIRVLPIFKLIESIGEIDNRDMFNTFNMGVGMTVIVSSEDADKALSVLKSSGEDAYVIGEILDSDEGVIMN